MTRLAILTTVPLDRDPRASRAMALAAAAGLDVEHVQPRLGAGRRRLRRWPRDLRRGWAASCAGSSAWLGWPSSPCGWPPQGRSLRADVVHANDLDTLPAGCLIARRAKARLVYDAHELYSGFEADPPRLWHRLSLALEGALARRADAVVTVSEPIAEELTHRLHLRRQPLLVLNCPPLEEVEVEPRPGAPVRAIYQAAVGPGRVLDDVVDAARAAPQSRSASGSSAGTAASPAFASSRRSLPAQLVSALAAYDVGLVIDRPLTDNARLALPNKLFEYLMAGLAVAVPRAPAMAQLVEEHGVGVVYDAGGLGAALQQLASDRGALDEMRRRARELAVTRFNAEAQAPALLLAWGL